MTPDIPYRDREVFELDAPIGNFSKPGYPRRRPALDDHERRNREAEISHLAYFKANVEPNLDKMNEAELRRVLDRLWQVVRGRRRVVIDNHTRRQLGRPPVREHKLGKGLDKKGLLTMINFKAGLLESSVDPNPPAEIVDTGQAGRDLYEAIAQYEAQGNPVYYCGAKWSCPTAEFPNAFVTADTDFFNNYRDCKHFDERSGRSRGSVVVSIQFMDKPDFRSSTLWLGSDHESPARGGRSMVVPLLRGGGTTWEFRGFEKLPSWHQVIVRSEVTVENLLAKFQALLAGEEGVEHYISHDCD